MAVVPPPAADLLLPYGRPVRDDDGHVRLPDAFARTGCDRVEVHRDTACRGHFLLCGAGRCAVDFGDMHELLRMLCADRRMVWPTLQSLVVPAPPEETGVVRFGIACHGADPRAVHAVVCAVACLLNPLALLDEVVALGVAVGMLVFNDNRTLSMDDLVVCEAWHRACFARVLPSAAAPWTPVTLQIRGRGRLRVPSPPRLPPAEPPPEEPRAKKRRRTVLPRRPPDVVEANNRTRVNRHIARDIMAQHREHAAVATAPPPLAALHRWNAWDRWAQRVQTHRARAADSEERQGGGHGHGRHRHG